MLTTAIVLSTVLASAVASLAPGVHSVNVVKEAKPANPQWLDKFNKIMNNSIPHDVPIGGDIWPVAVFWTFLEIGSPPVRFPVAVDSGSKTLDIPLKGCNGCVLTRPNAAYDPAASTSSKPVTCTQVEGCASIGGQCDTGRQKCTFSHSYETCDPTRPTDSCTILEIVGSWYTDQVSWGGVTANVTFGSIEEQVSKFGGDQFQHIDGVMGMIGHNPHTSVFQAFVDADAVAADIWSLCIVARPGWSINNGTISLGGLDSRLYEGEMQYTPEPNFDGYGFYEMTANALTIGNQAIRGLTPSWIIDSGTNVLLVPDEAFASMYQVFWEMCETTFLKGICEKQGDAPGQTLFDGKCFKLSQDDMAKFPPLTIYVPGIAIEMQPKDYLIQGFGPNATATEFCLGIIKTGPGGLQVIGDTTLQNYYVVFDRTVPQIGWAKVNTDTCGNI